MSVANCIARPVKAGRISKKIGDEALGLYDGLQGELGRRGVGASSAEAHAALETACIMAEGARRRKYAIAKQAIAQEQASARVASHPKGKTAGLMADMTADIHEAAKGANLESLTEAILNGRLMPKFRARAEAMRSRMGPLKAF